MEMPGGGYWNVYPGQVTDDSELAMCLMRGLVAGKGKFDLFHHCLYYGYWIKLQPFDIGRTTLNGLGPLAECLDNPNPEVAKGAARCARTRTSMSNGSLMRITPLAVWARNLQLHGVEQAVVADVSLMHSKCDMWDLITAYCLAIQTLLKNPENEQRASLAIKSVKNYTKRDCISPLVA